jgi:hypothetical protein
MSDFDNSKIRWPGSGSAVSSLTVPYGFYLNEPSATTSSIGAFEYDCATSAKWAAQRLGYPSIEIEMVDINFYGCFEEAVCAYGEQVNSFNIRNNLMNLQGVSTNNNFTGRAMTGPNLNAVVQIGKNYGNLIGVGGNIDIKKAPINLITNQQTYDLNTLIGTNIESGSAIEIRRIFHGPSPAFARIYDPFSMTGMSYSNVLNEMGFAGFSPATQFLMTPIFEDLLRGQAIEFNDMVRKSAYSFEIVNNKLKIFPIPTYDHPCYIEYVLTAAQYDANNLFYSGSNYSVVSDYSNVPYQNVVYYRINDVSKQWIRKYFLALCKETLGRILSKYSAVPISNGEITLDGQELRNEAKEEKEYLVTQLRENLERTTRRSQLEDKADEMEKMQSIIKGAPLGIYIG